VHLLNFSHPFSFEQLKDIARICNVNPSAIDVTICPVQIDMSKPLAPQIQAIVDAIKLTPEQWQREVIIINPPALSQAALTVIAELHGRIGHYPMMVRIVASHDGTATTFDVAEVINLDNIRMHARTAR